MVSNSFCCQGIFPSSNMIWCLSVETCVFLFLQNPNLLTLMIYDIWRDWFWSLTKQYPLRFRFLVSVWGWNQSQSMVRVCWWIPYKLHFSTLSRSWSISRIDAVCWFILQSSFSDLNFHIWTSLWEVCRKEQFICYALLYLPFLLHFSVIMKV